MKRYPDDTQFPILYKSIKEEAERAEEKRSRKPIPARPAPTDTSSRWPVGHDNGVISHLALEKVSFLIQGNTI
ncbi:MAG: hypothetical protein U1D30_10165 [Planctomycetota bacterium]